MTKFISILTIIIILTLPVNAETWETLFEVKTPENFAKVQIDKDNIMILNRSFKKAIRFRAKSEFINYQTKESIRGDILYESICETHESYKLDTAVYFYKDNKYVSQIKSKQKEAVTGKDLTDLIPIVDRLCK